MITIVSAVILLAVAVVLLGVKVLFVEGGKFPSHRHHEAPEQKKHLHHSSFSTNEKVSHAS